MIINKELYSIYEYIYLKWIKTNSYYYNMNNFNIINYVNNIQIFPLRRTLKKTILMKTIPSTLTENQNL